MHSSIRANDEADLNVLPKSEGHRQRIGCGQRLGWSGIFATRARAYVRNLAELGAAVRALPHSMLPIGERRLTLLRKGNLHCRGALGC